MPIHNPMSQSSVPDPSTRRLRDDRGFMIIEVLVSALILIMASLAVFSALDNADKAAGNQQRRALAANFAQSELERIRSLPVEDIAAMRGTRNLTRDDIDYAITTTAKWITDGDDEPECSSRSGGLDYMRITVSISWQGMGSAKPVSFTSLFTPTAGAGGDTGSVSVHLMNRNGGPVANVPVTLDGPATFTEITNKNGCVVFAFVPASLEYLVRFQRVGFVNEQSVNLVEEPATVTAKETTKLQFLYDSGGFTMANFSTRKSVNAGDGTIPSAPPALQMFHVEQTSPGVQVNLPAGTTSWNGSSKPWFPFTTPYSIYAGNCPKNSPPSTSWASRLVNITPLATQNAGNIQLPGLGVRVTEAGVPLSTTNNNVTVMVSADCNVNWSKSTGSDGRLLDPGVPYSTNTKVCAFATVSGAGKGIRRILYKQPISTINEWNTMPDLNYAGDGNVNLSVKSGPAATCFE